MNSASTSMNTDRALPITSNPIEQMKNDVGFLQNRHPLEIMVAFSVIVFLIFIIYQFMTKLYKWVSKYIPFEEIINGKKETPAKDVKEQRDEE
jgi:hypothetical protein